MFLMSSGSYVVDYRVSRLPLSCRASITVMVYKGSVSVGGDNIDVPSFIYVTSSPHDFLYLYRSFRQSEIYSSRIAAAFQEPRVC